MDLAASIQAVTEEIVLRLDARARASETGAKNLCLAGGVALNCVANGKLLRDGAFENIWMQPAAGDAGGALGAALAAYHHLREPAAHARRPARRHARRLSRAGVHARRDRAAAGRGRRAFHDARATTTLIEQHARRRWPTARRSAGSRDAWSSARARSARRSILGDPRSPTMQKTLNLKVKYRESRSARSRRRCCARTSPTGSSSTATAPTCCWSPTSRERRRRAMTEDEQALFGIDKLNVPRSDIPAVTHVDYSARIQTVHADTNPRFHALLDGASRRRPAARCWSTPASTCAASRSSARPRTPSAASWAPRSRCWWSATASCDKEDQDPALKLDYKDAFELD